MVGWSACLETLVESKAGALHGNVAASSGGCVDWPGLLLFFAAFDAAKATAEREARQAQMKAEQSALK